jgi:tetraacyldisaccharide 4'-kinase
MLSVISGERKGNGPAILRVILAALAYVYTAGLEIFLLPYRLGIRKQYRLPCPVISIGNLTVGGTGKTSMTMILCKTLASHGLKACVLNRGYRGTNEHGAVVVSNEKGLEASAEASGDEAFMLANMLPGTPILVGKDRRRTGQMAIDRFHPDIIILDDGMQFYQLYRDLDVVLIDAMRPFDNGWTFPRGLLREPPSHLSRAGCVVVTNADKVSCEEIECLNVKVKNLAPKAEVFQARYEAECVRALDRSMVNPANWLAGRKVGSFCALGNPQGFEQQLERAGAALVHTTRFSDHHSPTMGEMNKSIEGALAAGAEAMVVTEKDAVKLPPLARPLPFFVLEASLQVDRPEAFIALILKAVSL